jgi:hypothetical protein
MLLGQVTEDEMGSVCSTHGRGEQFIQILVGKLGGKISLRRPMNKWEDNKNRVERDELDSSGSGYG